MRCAARRQDHKKYLKNKADAAAAKQKASAQPEVDYTLKGPIVVSLHGVKPTAVRGGGGGGGGGGG